MQIDWQIVVVAACVLWAFIVVGRRAFRLFQLPAQGSCGSGSCHGCPSGAGADVPQNGLVQLGIPANSEFSPQGQSASANYSARGPD